MDMDLIAAAKDIVTDYWLYISGLVVTIVGGAGTAIFAFIRRPKSSTIEPGPYFVESTLLSPPLTRPAYSDRMAYVLAEMASLAYYQFEGKHGFIEDAIENASSLDLTKGADLQTFLEDFSTNLLGGHRLGRKSMERLLGNSGFLLLDVINIRETQAFVAKRIAKNEPPYLVLAFRGTEQKISDWLTDARCIPTVEGQAKVHTGFLEAFAKKTDTDGKTVQEIVGEILDRPEAKNVSGEPLPLFITGHSLGGALAILATKLIAPNVNGACYTFGAPRVGNYEYFRHIKTPVYRIVNSSDIVPRVPPGAGMTASVLLVQAIAWLTKSLPAISAAFDRLEALLDKLNGYRHFGDLRYLSDVAESRFDTVRLLSNPPTIDRIVWMWRRMGKSFFVPIKSHGMDIYRKKLNHIANERNTQRSE